MRPQGKMNRTILRTGNDRTADARMNDPARSWAARSRYSGAHEHHDNVPLSEQQRYAVALLDAFQQEATMK
jgi:hypothetical protein